MNCANMNEYALSFAAWELRLYLDTHPDDGRALAAYKQLCAAQGCCTYACNTPDGRNYRSAGGNAQVSGCKAPGGVMLSACRQPGESRVPECERWRWIDGPWPWEYEANIAGGKC